MVVGSPKPPAVPRGRPRSRRAAPAPVPGELPPCRLEKDLQTRCADFLRLALPPDEAAFHHSPQEMCRGGNQGMWQALRTSGFRTGWPDLEIVWRGRAFFIELKIRGNPPTEAQDGCHADLRAAGAPVAVATSLEEMYVWLVHWGVPLRVTPEEFARAGAGGRMTAAAYRALGGAKGVGNAIGQRRRGKR